MRWLKALYSCLSPFIQGCVSLHLVHSAGRLAALMRDQWSLPRSLPNLLCRGGCHREPVLPHLEIIHTHFSNGYLYAPRCAFFLPLLHFSTNCAVLPGPEAGMEREGFPYDQKGGAPPGTQCLRPSTRGWLPKPHLKLCIVCVF